MEIQSHTCIHHKGWKKKEKKKAKQNKKSTKVLEIQSQTCGHHEGWKKKDKTRNISYKGQGCLVVTKTNKNVKHEKIHPSVVNPGWLDKKIR